ncbi:ATP-binding protein [Pseudoruegeria sp. SK021]|uniref:ATP-binding protein n=1 Tax=Pseudoruegeria sp. SK021 TaxID=1933035 RepID=UPI000A21CE5F|nr:ATP-binding protein [Pseudoruegeria sp. SK021]OSP54380.1 hypothetical protein BV911_12940 [Pseudoruegeria sp. SK021]
MKKWIEIDDRSAIAALRRLARRYATSIDLPERRLEEMAIVVTEAATNVLRYAERGRALIEVIHAPGVEKIVLVFTDHGPGIGDMDRMFQDGESSSGSAGLGLSAIRRLSDTFDIFSSAADGTTIVCTFDRQNSPPNAAVLDIEGLRVCHPAESVCGDDWMLRQTPEATDVLVCDGLGHGSRAAEAAAELIQGATNHAADPAATITALSADLVGHRGAVAAMIRIHMADLTMAYSALGNIATLCIGATGIRRLAVRDGRIGGQATHGFEDTIQLAPGDILILHSDGLKTLRDKNFAPGLLGRSPLLIAAFLLDRAFRGRDDASIVVARLKAEPRS